MYKISYLQNNTFRIEYYYVPKLGTLNIILMQF